MKVAAVFCAGVAVGVCAGLVLAAGGPGGVELPDGSRERVPGESSATSPAGDATAAAAVCATAIHGSAAPIAGPGAPGESEPGVVPTAGPEAVTAPVPARREREASVLLPDVSWVSGVPPAVAMSRRYLLNLGNGGNGVFVFEQLPNPEEVLGEALVKAVREAAPGSPEQAAALVGLRDKLRDPDEKVAGAALALLEELSPGGRLPVAALAAIEDDFRGLPAKHAHRARLAALIAGALGEDPRLNDFLDRLPRPEEADVRAAVLAALDRTPSPAGRRWIERILTEETEADVLTAALEPDRFGTAVTRTSAPGLVTALERRMRRADLSTDLRGAAYRALALAGMHAPGAAAALSHASAQEADPVLAAFARDAERAVSAGEANPGVIGHLWARHHPASAVTTARAVAFSVTTTASGKLVEPVPVAGDK